MRFDDEDDDEQSNFEWVGEDDNEVSEDRQKPLSALRPIASIVFLVLIALFVLFMLGKALTAIRGMF